MLLRNRLALAMLVAATTARAQPAPPLTSTPIEYVVVLFQENVSFDQYIGLSAFVEPAKQTAVRRGTRYTRHRRADAAVA